jgi:signal-transduction protein with cAMP-binding, CBS, and nucleotidyltransferase domain
MVIKNQGMMPKTPYKKGSIIYSVNSPSDSVYLVHTGSVQLETKNGMVLGKLSTGELFGEVGLITSELRTVTVRANTDCIVIKIGETVFQEKMQKADPICTAIIRGLALRINDANDLAEQYWKELALYKSLER